MLHRMIDTCDAVFNIANHGVHPGKCFMLHAFRTTACNYGDMLAINVGDGIEAGKTITVNDTTRLQMFERPFLDFVRAKSTHNLKVHILRMTIFIR